MDQLISTVAVFVAAFIFGVLAHRSPKKDWEFIKTWPAFALLIVSTAFSQVEYFKEQAPKFVGGEFQNRCEWVKNDLGILLEECKLIYVPGTIETKQPSLEPVVDWFRSWFISSLLDIPTGLIGTWLGMLAARKTDRKRQLA